MRGEALHHRRGRVLNCEWSTELTVPQAYDEYVKAWFACKLMAREFGLGDSDGFVFNMSVGYDLAGIKSEKIDNYIEGHEERLQVRRVGGVHGLDPAEPGRVSERERGLCPLHLPGGFKFHH